ncbi:MAG: hypothetical protein ACQESN_10620 [Thermotogota bacterium]
MLKQLQQRIEKSAGTIEEMQKNFYDSAVELLNNYKLTVGDQEFQLTEIEFYHFNCKNHKDPYTHTDALQLTCDNLYVHKQPWIRGGIDITFGKNEYFGGILIRGIKHKQDYVAGSATVKKYIAKAIGCKEESHDILQACINKKHTNSVIQKLVQPEKEKIYHSFRIGLNPEYNDDYAKALYRFVRRDYLSAKNNNNFKTYKNLKDRSRLKAITSLTMSESCNEKSTLKQIEKDETLSAKINSFKDINS